MIYIMFEHFGEKVLVEINNNNVYFSTTLQGPVKAPIDKLKLNYRGVIREFPDLEGSDDWKEQAVKRFKDNLSNMPSETEKVNYIIHDLKNHGYIPLYKQKNGFRPEVIK